MNRTCEEVGCENPAEVTVKDSDGKVGDFCQACANNIVEASDGECWIVDGVNPR